MSESSEIAARRPRLPAPIRAMRPRQWIKNVLVLSAPLAAGDLFVPDVIIRAGIAFVAFCLISAAVYLVNDVRDVEEDRQHPKQRFRPIAAGELGTTPALVLAAVCAVLGLGLGFATAVPLGVTLAAYAIIQVVYSTWLKHYPVIDLAVVSSGFLLRAVAGGVATGIPL